MGAAWISKLRVACSDGVVSLFGFGIMRTVFKPAQVKGLQYQLPSKVHATKPSQFARLVHMVGEVAEDFLANRSVRHQTFARAK